MAKKEAQPELPMPWQHPTGRNPECIAVVAMGPSYTDFIDSGSSSKTQVAPWQEVWTLNGMGRTVNADLLFAMDDLRYCLMHSPGTAQAAHDFGGPVITSTPYKDFKNALAYPLAEVLGWAKSPLAGYLNHCVPQMLAYAGFIGVKQIFMFGCDYTHPERPEVGKFRQDYRACTEFWIGVLSGRGINVTIAPKSTLLDTLTGHKVYGYLIAPRLVQKGDEANGK